MCGKDQTSWTLSNMEDTWTVRASFLSYFFVKKYLLVGASGILWTGQWVSQ